MIKGTQKTETTFEKKFYTGFGEFEIVAICPTRAQLDKILGITEREEEPKEIDYLSTDGEGNRRVRLTFLMRERSGELVYNSILLTEKFRTNKDGTKYQFVNSVCQTAWAENESVLPDWFTKCYDKEKNYLGDRIVRKALVGEEEFVTLIRSWLGKLDFYSKDTEVFADTKKLFAGNFKDLQGIMDTNFVKPFVALVGVRTKDGEDGIKQYQGVYQKSYLPLDLLKTACNAGNTSNSWHRKVWDKFYDDLVGEYGYKDFYTISPFKEYNKDEDVSSSVQTFVQHEGPAF